MSTASAMKRRRQAAVDTAAAELLGKKLLVPAEVRLLTGIHSRGC